MGAEADKTAARREALAKLAAVTPEQRRAWSDAIVRSLTDEIQESDTVLMYAPLPAEPEIAEIAERYGTLGKLCVPRVDWARAAMEPALVRSLDDLSPGRFGVREPTTTAPGVPLDRLGTVLVPGLAFDARGARLGRGGGFYDRFIARLGSGVRTIGVCFDLQVVAEVPAEKHDARVDLVVTESRILTA